MEYISLFEGIYVLEMGGYLFRPEPAVIRTRLEWAGKDIRTFFASRPAEKILVAYIGTPDMVLKPKARRSFWRTRQETRPEKAARIIPQEIAPEFIGLWNSAKGNGYGPILYMLSNEVSPHALHLAVRPQAQL